MWWKQMVDCATKSGLKPICKIWARRTTNIFRHGIPREGQQPQAFWSVLNNLCICIKSTFIDVMSDENTVHTNNVLLKNCDHCFLVNCVSTKQTIPYCVASKCPGAILSYQWQGICYVRRCKKVLLMFKFLDTLSCYNKMNLLMK